MDTVGSELEATEGFMRGTSQEQINKKQDGEKSQENKSIVDEKSAGGAANEIVGEANTACSADGGA